MNAWASASSLVALMTAIGYLATAFWAVGISTVATFAPAARASVT